MKKLQGEFAQTYEVKRSIFHARLVPYASFEATLLELKCEHPKATHIVTAYRYLNRYDQIVEHSSDDGEPKGCAGVPVLNVLKGKELIDAALLVVRYFGGIKLGTGGVARAYSAAAKQVIAQATLQTYQKEISLTFECLYGNVDRVLYWLKRLEIEDVKRHFGSTGVRWVVKGSKEKIARLKESLENFGVKIG